MRLGITAGLIACALATAAHGQMTLQSSRAVYVERDAPNQTGKIIEPASTLMRGDTVILMVEWQAGAQTRDLTISSAVPKQLAFQQSSVDAYAVSVDGGRNWGKIGTLRITDRYGERVASVEDVTHLRWRINATRAKGNITYSAIVR
ncbi:hypothetical protein GCM10023115_19060 [Pontixanthobacter gangjinensis]|uniref:Uncharacterized protein n=1 Tax=Pontixanthobacter gangjinensis TaxID=1028742 RepID=A0A6I4SMZ1_9SPHN|nr:hypothetical protein [Pontixanthobacter gangjinensis]MXO57155.1 hypothetical protein [Pontixanthobacter gangjinensis]